MDPLQLFGALSVILFLAGTIPYIIDILRGNTKPHRMAMFIFVVLSAIAFTGQLLEGAEASLWFAGVLLINQITLFILSFKYGMGGFTTREKISLALTALILIFWYLTDSVAIALVLTVTVNTIGKLLIMAKVYDHPYTELLYSWIMSTFASVFAVLAVGELDWLLILVPAQNAITVGIVAGIIIIRRKQLKLTHTHHDKATN
ncbi:MAG: hypothetical protein WAS36_01780 [Candidatus Saccharimonadales bacterium]